MNKLNRFWSEIKRRKVFRVLTMYAATGFIIMEASDIMLPRLGLPDWTVTLIIVLLIIGFPLTAIFSWIFDITPEGLIKTMPRNEEKKVKDIKKPARRLLNLNNIVITLLFAAVVILAYPEVLKSNKSRFERVLEKKRIIAVLPLMNNTGDDSYDHWEYGISELLINTLSTYNELTIIDNQTISDVINNVENVQTASIGPDLAGKVANRIQVKSYIYGNYILAGSTFRINLKLIETKTNKVLKTFFVEGRPDSIFSMVGTLSDAVTDYLEISLMEEGTDFETSNYLTTNSPEAYKYFIQGMEDLWAGRGSAAYELYMATQIDPEFTSAYFFLSIFFSSIDNSKYALEFMLKAYEGKEKLPEKMQLWLEAFRAQYKQKNPYQTIHFFEQVSKIDPLSRLNWYWLGNTYNQIENYNDALLAYEEILKLNKQFGPWKNQHFYNSLGNTYIHLKKYNKGQKILEEGLSLFPESVDLLRSHAVCDLLQNDTISANQYLDQLRSSYRKTGIFPEPWIISLFGKIYYEVGQPEKAENLFRQALEMRLSQGPEIDTINAGNNLYWYYDNLGSLLISGNVDVEEGMDYMQKAMALSKTAYSDYHPYVLHNLGSGLYKQGRYKEALHALKEAEDKMFMYDHHLHQLIEKTEQALADQQN